MNAPTPAKRLILIVDDDQLLAAFLSEVLGNAGYDTVQAYSADQALAQVAEREPDMALLDIHMPGMSGLELAKQLNRNTAFEVLRDHARSSRRKINEIADQLLTAEETLNGLHAAFNTRLKK